MSWYDQVIQDQADQSNSNLPQPSLKVEFDPRLPQPNPKVPSSPTKRTTKITGKTKVEFDDSSSTEQEQLTQWVEHLQANPGLAKAFLRDFNSKQVPQKPLKIKEPEGSSSQTFLQEDSSKWITISKKLSKPEVEQRIVPSNVSAPILKKASETALAKNKIEPFRPNTTGSSYVQKSQQSILIMEAHYECNDPRMVASKIFPLGWHFKPKTMYKNQLWYELILIDTGSITIKHFEDPEDSHQYTHASVQIMKVIRPSEWGISSHFKSGIPLHHPLQFTSDSKLPSFTYWDYQDAWLYAFLYQNNRLKHSYLFQFSKKGEMRPENFHFPNWFYDWFHFFGPIEQIFPQTVFQGFQKFKTFFQGKINPDVPSILRFCIQFNVPWISAWQYHFQPLLDPKYPPGRAQLIRQFNCKWWDRFATSNCDEDRISRWISSVNSQETSSHKQDSKFLQNRSQLSSLLVGTKDEEEMADVLQAMLMSLRPDIKIQKSEESEAEASAEGSDPDYDPTSLADD